MSDLFQSLHELDVQWFTSLNRALHLDAPGWTHGLWAAVNAFGSPFVLLPVAAAILLLSRRAWDGTVRVGVLLLAQGLNLGVVQGLKSLTSRARPQGQLADAFARGEVFAALGEAGLEDGFPSGHTSFVAVLGVFLIVWTYTRLGRGRGRACTMLVVFFCGMMGLARVYAGMHFPLDVLAGALIGALNCGVVLYACHRWGLNWMQAPVPDPKDGLA